MLAAGHGPRPACEEDRPLDATFVAIDLETTGLNAERDAIIEIGAVRFSGRGVEDEFSSVVQPEVEVPFRIQRLTGLDAAALRDAPSLASVLPALTAFVGQCPLVAHSIEHDMAFLTRHGVLAGQQTIDTFELACILVPEAAHYGLVELLALLGIADPEAPHRALPDAHRHRKLFQALCERARSLGKRRLEYICRLAANTSWSLKPVFESALAHPLPAPATRPPAEKIGPRLQPREAVEPVDGQWLESLIALGGLLSEAMPDFEDRPGQRQMLRRCVSVLNDGGQLMVEAGTGTGKSLAYLLPAAAWARANGRPVVVSTHTLHLQDQLLHKDFAVVRRLLGDDVQATALKGRSNYLCRSRLEQLLRRTDLDLPAVRAAAKILAWERLTQTGDQAELMLQPDEQEAWRLVGAEREGCLPDRCRHALQGGCWLQRARRKAEAAHVIVVNHALLLSDMLTANRLLPHYGHLVIDEAHHLEEVATKALGVAVTEARIRQAVADLLASNGPVASVAATSQRWTRDDAQRKRCSALLLDVERVGRQLAAASGALFACLAAVGEVHNGEGRPVRLTAALRASPGWLEVESAWEVLAERLGELDTNLERLHEELAAVESWLGDGLTIAASLAVARQTFAEVDAALRRILDRPVRQDVHWLESRGGGLELCAAPLFVGDLLASSLFHALDATILTSATLRAGEGFDFLRDRLGLRDAEEEVVPSPFEFEEHALLFVPQDMPDPDQPEYQTILDRTLTSLALATEGRLLVLYTSHRGLRRSYWALSGPLGRAGMLVLGQGIDGGRDRLLSVFRETDVPCVLLGTRSFWEGIDVPGPALSALVVARLPFDVPTDPIFEARAESFEDPFTEFSLPLAVLRFRQGFGRLIRSQSDRGVVAVLDGRIRRGYGRAFLDALPPCQRYSGSVLQLPDVAARFLAADGRAARAGRRKAETERQGQAIEPTAVRSHP